MLGRSSIAAGGWLLEKYLSRVVRSHPVEWYTPSGGNLALGRLDTVISYVEGLSQSRPLLFPFWNAHSLLVLTAYIANPGLHGALRHVQAVADDSAGGRLTQSLFRRAGLRLRLLRHIVQAERLSDIAGILTDRPDIAIAIDSHGPYKLVGVPIARLARSLGATVVPISALAHREVRVFREIGMSVPLPTTRIAVAFDAPIDCRTLSLVEIREQIARSLDALDVRLEETS
jgi:lysophospholipid acyltransferase (LPLAT)-like uncharacterized protein